MTRGPGRPSLGHEGHRGRPATCDACTLRRWREGKGLTQAQAAQSIPSGRSYHTSLRAYTAWERGEVPPPVLVMRLVAMLAEVTS